MTKFSIQKKEHDEMHPPKVMEVRLVISEHEECGGLPTLTHWCLTEAEVEAKFDRIIADIQKKKFEALTLLRKSKRAH